MIFVDKTGAIKKGRRAVSAATSVQTEEVKNPAKLAEIIRNALRRITELEAKSTASAIEFERDVLGGGALYTFIHNFGKPVRFWVTFWKGASAAPILAQDASSTNNQLVLASSQAGTVVVRIEPAEAGLSA